MEHSCPPPDRFRAAVGVRSARFLPGKPQFITRGKSRGKFAVGVKYEREVQEYLSEFVLGKPEVHYMAGPWLEFYDKSGRRFCQPDALLVERGKLLVTICEIKYRHISDAWWQLKELYLPVLRVAMSEFGFRLVEIVHWFDSSTAWPERVIHVPAIDSVPIRSDSVAVLIFNRRRERRVQPIGDCFGSGADKAPDNSR